MPKHLSPNLSPEELEKEFQRIDEIGIAISNVLDEKGASPYEFVGAVAIILASISEDVSELADYLSDLVRVAVEWKVLSQKSDTNVENTVETGSN
jgi:hypothetical protein